MSHYIESPSKKKVAGCEEILVNISKGDILRKLQFFHH